MGHRMRIILLLLNGAAVIGFFVAVVYAAMVVPVMAKARCDDR